MIISWLYIQMIITALCTALACCLPGTFLVLRGTSLMSDAISHAIFLGIVLSFLMLQQFWTPILYVGALITALLTVWAIEKTISTKYLKADAVIAVTFPLLFSIAVILINLYAKNIHLDIDAVLLGELAFTPFYQLIINGAYLGSYHAWIMFFTLIMNCIIIKIWYKKLIATTFDPHFATLIKYSPYSTYWVLMIMTSITILAAFDAVGAILVVAFIIVPPATAYVLTSNMRQLLIINVLISILGSMSGILIAHCAETSIAGSIATTYCGIFTVAYLATKIR
ncbi:metal ABC transporter permease [Candidatus Babeliales bacterium]|nr:metal ABC transporter permease [Candidatus Babeliales bacterium]